MESAIVIPTYNEANNIELLLKGIFSTLDAKVIVVDDASPDGTGEICERLKNQYQLEGKEIIVIHRKRKMGLGSAYISGFRRALDTGVDFIFEMDGDLSHDPSYLPNFLKKMNEYDVALGSRYIAGGGIRNWSTYRKLMSKYANLLAKRFLGININDCTSGYRCYRRDVLETVGLEDINSEGYAFQVEILYKCIRKGFRVAELPIIFTERRGGKSKLSKKEVPTFFATLLKLRLEGV
jgi:dolichol-phosphate mannosyltransferase